MIQASENLEFEKALMYKNMLESISKVVSDKQNIEKDNRGDRDIFAYYTDRGYLAIAGMLVRKGTILNKEYKLKPLYGDAQEEFISFCFSTMKQILPQENLYCH